MRAGSKPGRDDQRGESQERAGSKPGQADQRGES